MWNRQNAYNTPAVLIVPLWNWNWNLPKPLWKRQQVLIVPLWNWNVSIGEVITTANTRFNRTFMELKSHYGLSALSCSVCFNRTFMELKCGYRLTASGLMLSFNRTFMELKLISAIVTYVTRCVLIVPLWNWNERCDVQYVSGAAF